MVVWISWVCSGLRCVLKTGIGAAWWSHCTGIEASLLHIYYTLRNFQQLWYMQKMLSNCIIQPCALWWWTN